MALLTGCLLGGLLAQLITAMQLASLGYPYRITWTLYPDTLLLTALFFLVSFVVIGLFNIRAIRRLGMIQDDQVLSYEPANADKMNPDWIDADKKIYGYSASAVGVIYNTTQIDQLDADWSELGSDPAYKDLISIPDPVKSGACKDFLSGYSYAFGEEAQSVIDSWVANGLTNPGPNKAALEAVTTGEKAILIAGVDYNAYSSMDKGEPLSIYYPASGTVINPRPAMILKTSQNTDNAKAFMDFLLSDEGQQLVCDAYLLPGRTDITTDKRTNAADIPTFDLDWSWMMENSARIAEDLVNSCK